MYDVRADASLVESAKSVTESQLRSKAAVGAVVNIPRHKQEVDRSPDTKIDDGIKGFESRFPQLCRYLAMSF